MDDSDLDFADLCSKLLKRVRKKERGDSGDEQRREASQNVTQNGAPEPSRSRKHKRDTESSARGQLYCGSVSMTQLDRPAREESASQARATQALAVPFTAPSAPSILAPAEFRTAGLSPRLTQNGDVNMRAKDKVVSRMQQFRWASPKKMMREQDDLDAREGLGMQITNSQSAAPQVDSAQGPQGDEALALEDEALALRLQRELDQETQGPETLVDLELGGLFFCQICQKDLSAMSPLRRTQHINRCLDESEGSGPPAMAPPPVPECPICGKAFKTQKSRASHLKRCSAEMGVSPADLLQALQRQAAEVARDIPANQPPPTTSSKRKASASDPTRPPKKRQKKKALPLDEDTMVALALSRSMVQEERERAREREREMEREREALGTAVPEAADAKLPGLQWRAEAGKRRGKKKDRPQAPPPLLLVQDPEMALRRLQNRVSALLLRSHPSCPPTPPHPTSCLLGWSGAAPLWQKSALQDGGGCSVEQFYTPALCPPIQPWDAAIVKEVQTPAPPTHTEKMPPAHQPTCPAPSTPGLGSQVLGDLMELAEEGMTLTQWGYAPNVDPASDSTPDPEPMRNRDCDEDELRLSGFIPERLQRAGATNSAGALSKLAADLSSMVNNPQLSDVQLQVDSGEVFFAHSFMLYARCPLLVQMVHDSGFGVEEEGMPSARRVLLGDVPGEAVYALLQYLYCAQCPLTPMLLPHLQELAHRWDLGELSRLCQGYTGGSVLPPEQQCREEEEDEEERGEQRFLELLRSMWEGEEEQQGDGEGEREGEETQDGGAEGRVDEEELLEIYEFAATQRRTRREGEGDCGKAGPETEEGEEERERRERSDDLSPLRQTHIPADPRAASEASTPDWLRSGHMSRAPPITGTRGAAQPPQPSPGRRSCGSLNRSYERLFSETWGEYTEPSQQEMQSSRSQGALIDLSVSPATDPCGSAFPSAGVSPGSVTGETSNEMALKREGSQSQHEPELIELSDSGEELDPGAPLQPPSFSHSPLVSPAPGTDVGHSVGDASPEVDSSAEVSWLIPGTPPPPAQLTQASISTQTHRSMCRTRLFSLPRPSSSSSSSPRARPSLTPSSAIESDPAHDLSGPAPSCIAQPTLLRLPESPSSASTLPRNPALDGALSCASPCPDSSTPLYARTSPKRAERHLQSNSCSTAGSTPLRLRLSDSPPQKHLSHEEKEGMEGEAEGAGSSPPLMDDPPMAFDDSWGLEGGGGRDSCLSLRLDSSAGASQSEQGSGEAVPTAPPPQQPLDHTRSYTSLLDSKVWDDWGEEPEEGAGLPLSQRVQNMAATQSLEQLKTPVTSRSKSRVPLVPITPMPGYSDMDTPDLKTQLNRFGVRPLPRRQMVLKLKEIHHFTHQLLSSEESDEDCPGPAPLPKPRPGSASAAFKRPEGPAPVGVWSVDSSQKGAGTGEEGEGLSASQGSTASSTANSEESERSNPELCVSSDSDGSDCEGAPASQAASREAEKLKAVRSLIRSDAELYGRVLRYEPLVLRELQAQLKANGVRLGASKLLDFLDSQCITFTTANPSKPARQARGRGKGRGRRRGATAKASD